MEPRFVEWLECGRALRKKREKLSERLQQGSNFYHEKMGTWGEKISSLFTAAGRITLARAEMGCKLGQGLSDSSLPRKWPLIPKVWYDLINLPWA